MVERNLLDADRHDGWCCNEFHAGCPVRKSARPARCRERVCDILSHRWRRTRCTTRTD